MKKIVSVIIMLVLVMFVSMVACNAYGNDMYNAYLSALNNGFIYYSLYDIDKNGITELIVYKGGTGLVIPSFSYDLTIYTIKNGRLAYVGEISTKDNLYCSQETGVWTWYNNGSAGNEKFNHYLIKNEKIAEGTKSLEYYYSGNIAEERYNYSVEGKVVNKSQYDKERKELFTIEKYDDICILDEIKDEKGKIGEVINHTLYTDIVTKINGCDIPSYNINGYTAVAAEDLRDYGFDVLWDENARSISVLRNYEKPQITSLYEAPKISYGKVGKRARNVLRTDIISYVNGKQVVSHNIGGKTIVYFNDLSVFGEVSYDDSERVLSLTIAGLSNLECKADIERRHRITVKTRNQESNREINKLVGVAEAYLDGNEIWRYETPAHNPGGSGRMISREAYIAGDTAYFGTWNDGFVAIDLFTGAIKWKYNVWSPQIRSIRFDDNGAVVLLLDSIRGEEFWQELIIDKDGNVLHCAEKKIPFEEYGEFGWNYNARDMYLSGNIITVLYDDVWQQSNITSY